MDFKNLFKAPVLIPSIGLVLILGALIIRSFPKEAAADVMDETVPSIPAAAPTIEPRPQEQSSPEDLQIEQELSQDRQEQKQTKYLKNKLEQSNLELEDEKVMAEINKLKMENIGNVKELSDGDGNGGIPEVKVEYIGGNDFQKEAVLSIGGSNFQVKGHSRPTDKIQVLSISDSSVTLHFNAPISITKTFEFKPE